MATFDNDFLLPPPASMTATGCASTTRSTPIPTHGFNIPVTIVSYDWDGEDTVTCEDDDVWHFPAEEAHKNFFQARREQLVRIQCSWCAWNIEPNPERIVVERLSEDAPGLAELEHLLPSCGFMATYTTDSTDDISVWDMADICAVRTCVRVWIHSD